jgi:hypothetical protein
LSNPSPSDYVRLLKEASTPVETGELADRLGLKYKTVRFMVRVLELMNCVEKAGSLIRAKNIDKCISLLTEEDFEAPGSPSQPSGARQIVALLSDIHVGRKTPSFNVNILRDRVKKYVDSLTRVVSENGGKLVVLGLGDYVDGSEIYPRQEYEQELDPNEQVDVAFNLTRELFEIVDVFYGIVGNHGRTSKDEHGNYDYFYLLQVKGFMGQSATISKRHHEYYRLPDGGLVLLSHPPPPRIYSYHGIPDYGIKRLIHNHIVASPELKEAYFGHFHIPKVSYEAIPLFINGTFLSDDEYSKTMGFKSQPSQMVVVKSPLGNKIYVIDL